MRTRIPRERSPLPSGLQREHAYTVSVTFRPGDPAGTCLVWVDHGPLIATAYTTLIASTILNMLAHLIGYYDAQERGETREQCAPLPSRRWREQ
jgi:hypothetical protein